MRGEPFTGSLFKGSKDQQTRLQSSSAKRCESEKDWLALCRLVDARDGQKCRACKRRVVRTLSLTPERAEHHHVTPRSLGGEHLKANVCVLCLACHELRHVTRELEIKGNADRALTFTRGGKSWKG